KHYGVVLSVLALAFGSFYYRPGTIPARLGIASPAAYPDSHEFWRVLRQRLGSCIIMSMEGMPLRVGTTRHAGPPTSSSTMSIMGWMQLDAVAHRMAGKPRNLS